MHDNLLYAVISTISEKTNFKCAEVSDEMHQEFEKLNLDLNTKRLFQWQWFSEDVEVGPTIYSSKRVLETEKENNYLKTGIIEIGYCPNGDEIFLRAIPQFYTGRTTTRKTAIGLIKKRMLYF